LSSIKQNARPRGAIEPQFHAACVAARACECRLPSSIRHTRTKAIEVQRRSEISIAHRSERLYEKDHPRSSTAWTAPTIPSATRRSSGGLEIRGNAAFGAPRIGDATCQTRGRNAGAGNRLQRRADSRVVLFKEIPCRRTGHARAGLAKASLLRSEDPANGAGNACAGATSGEPRGRHFYQIRIGAQGGHSAGSLIAASWPMVDTLREKRTHHPGADLTI